MQRALPARRAAVMVRLDIGRAAGQQDAVEPVEDRAAIGHWPDRRDQHRQPADRVDDSARVALVDRVEGALVDRAHTARDADQWQGTGGHLSRRSLAIGSAA